jgi:thiosulfate/3-mercaptopyruvate sulfurtransferase
MKQLVSIIVLALFALTSVQAQCLISAKELAVKMKYKNCVVVSAEKAANYNKVHIKGAVNVPYNELNSSSKGYLKSSSAVAQILGKKGISQTNTIVVYDEGKGKYAGRLYWVLKYLGAKDVKILNGGLTAWKAARKPITKMPTTLKAKTFTPAVKSAYRAKITDVKAGTYMLVDVRSPEEFNGTKEDSFGHIPGAVNFPFSKVLSSGKLKSKADLAAAFKAKGITSDKKIILYCKTSVRAGIVFLALKSILNYPNVKVYDGALNEWKEKGNKIVK